MPAKIFVDTNIHISAYIGHEPSDARRDRRTKSLSNLRTPEGGTAAGERDRRTARTEAIAGFPTSEGFEGRRSGWRGAARAAAGLWPARAAFEANPRMARSLPQD